MKIQINQQKLKKKNTNTNKIEKINESITYLNLEF